MKFGAKANAHGGQPNKEASTADFLAQHIRNQIITHELPPNYVFPNETQFCLQLGVARSTLREAYKVLESNSLITRTKRGTYVNDYATMISSMPFGTTIEMSDLNELMEFRSMVETELAGLAAERAIEENITNLHHFLQGMKDNQHDLSKLTFYDMQFHIEVANASHNRLLMNTMKVAADLFSKGIYNSFLIDTDTNVQQALTYHEIVLHAIVQKDKTMARNAMKSHVISISERVNMSLNTNSDADADAD